jgi:thymidylate synthase (FAD)
MKSDTTVELIDHMGNDLRIVNCARVSYGKESKELTEGDKGLIDYMIREGHSSPVESVKFTFKISAPIFVLRQLMRSRTGVFNEISGRYVTLPEEYFLPNELNPQSSSNHQGREEGHSHESSEVYIKAMQSSIEESFSTYNSLIEGGVSKEQARTVLPVATMSHIWWTIDLHNLFHFLKTRLDGHAQLEIRELAQKIFDIIEPIVPVAVASWKYNIFNGVSLNEAEKDFFFYLLNQHATEGTVSEHLDARQIRILKEKMGL